MRKPVAAMGIGITQFNLNTYWQSGPREPQYKFSPTALTECLWSVLKTGNPADGFTKWKGVEGKVADSASKLLEDCNGGECKHIRECNGSS